MKDYKDAFQEAYDDALEDGLSVAEAERIAGQAATDWHISRAEQADDLRDRQRELNIHNGGSGPQGL